MEILVFNEQGDRSRLLAEISDFSSAGRIAYVLWIFGFEDVLGRSFVGG